SPISRLPTELIAYIFILLSNIDRPSYPAAISGSPTYPCAPTLGWIAVTHVCRLWREIALDYPSLWANVEFAMGSDWTQLMLARARSSPLALNMYRPQQRLRLFQDDEVDLIVQSLARAKEFRFCLAVDADKTARILRTPAPALETLEIQFGTDLNEFNSLPQCFLGGHTPFLRHLRLRTVTRFPWTSHLLTNLVTLHV
ncbi:hypothetical protein FA95DRAFT_1477356, partial [Auriscalpium vulgare]